MIYFSENPIQIWQPNIIRLDLEEDKGFIYLSLNTYDQAVLIADRFSNDPELVCRKLGGDRNQEEVYRYMLKILPRPINILAPFYHLIDNSVTMDVNDMKQLIGVLSYMSMHLDFNIMIKVPREVRANLIYSKSILLDYLRHFEDFTFQISTIQNHIVNNGSVGYNNNYNSYDTSIASSEVEVKETGYGYTEEEAAAFLAGWADDDEEEVKEEIKEEIKEEVKEEKKEVGSSFVEQSNEVDAYNDIIKRLST